MTLRDIQTRLNTTDAYLNKRDNWPLHCIPLCCTDGNPVDYLGNYMKLLGAVAQRYNTTLNREAGFELLPLLRILGILDV